MRQLRHLADHWRRDDGFTLIEVLVTCLLLSIGIFSSIGIFLDSQKGTSSAHRTDIAVTIGTQKLEQMRALPYDKVAVAQYVGTLPSPPAGSVDPFASRRTNGNTRFTTGLPAPEAASEEIVPYLAGAKYNEYEEIVVGSGPGSITARVYTVVTWHDEECPLADLTKLKDAVGNLKTILTTLVGPSPNGVLANLTGPGGSLTTALGNSNTLLGGVVSALVAPLTTIVNTLQPLSNALDPLEGPLKDLLAQLEALPVSQLTGAIDLCDLPAGTIPDLSSIKTLTTALNSVNQLLPTLTSRVNSVLNVVNPLLNANVLALLAAVPDLLNLGTLLSVVEKADFEALIASLTNDLGETITLGNLDDLAEDVEESLSGLATFLNAPNHTHNNKRVWVGVQIVPNGRGRSVGPTLPVWQSTIVSDPKDGLL